MDHPKSVRVYSQADHAIPWPVYVCMYVSHVSPRVLSVAMDVQAHRAVGCGLVFVSLTAKQNGRVLVPYIWPASESACRVARGHEPLL